MSHPESPSAAETLGARLDALLAPFTADEQRLQDGITKLEGQIADLQAEIEGSRADLSVVQSSKVESLREAAKTDPLLSVAFMGLVSEAGPASDDLDLAIDPPAEPGGHSLLKM